MFKQLTVILILFAFLMQTFNRVVIVTQYYTNTAAFAKNCENKAKPQLKCNGKCQMMKKLKQEEKKDQQNSERKSYQDEVLSSKNFFAVINLQYSNVKKSYPFLYQCTQNGTHSLIFRPPSV